jgi:dihydrodipicolinate synthase/N-acetylneuraminate lyase
MAPSALPFPSSQPQNEFTMPASSTAPAATTANRPRFHGIVPPLATPLVDRDTLDVGGLERLIEHVLAGGVHGLFVLGTTGEGPMLSPAVRRAVIERTLRQVGARAPVLVGITDTVLSDSLDLARFAAEQGAAAVVAAPPYYFPAGQEPLERWARAVAAGVPLPLVIYNMPEMVKVVLEADTVRRLADLPGIVGIKDSGGDLEVFADYARVVRDVRPDWTLLIGPEETLPQAHALGGHGGVCGGANVAPDVFVGLQTALEAGDESRAAALHKRVLTIGRLYGVSTQPGRVVVGVKAALREFGICGDAAAGWFELLNAEQRGRIAEIVAAIRAPERPPAA